MDGFRNSPLIRTVPIIELLKRTASSCIWAGAWKWKNLHFKRLKDGGYFQHVNKTLREQFVLNWAVLIKRWQAKEKQNKEENPCKFSSRELDLT